MLDGETLTCGGASAPAPAESSRHTVKTAVATTTVISDLL